ncbi:MAG: mandelate racemase/muconate lactonizing enzyme family protein, partial [Clostridia bacterium]
FGDTQEKLMEGCVDAKIRGFTAVGHLTPFLDSPREENYFSTFSAKMDKAIERVFKYREAVGTDVDLCIEIHRQLTVPEAITLGREIEKCHPLFYEDPVRPDNFDDMAKVAHAVGISIATGERFHTLQEFQMLLSRDACHYIRPDVCMCGGLTGAKKIAALAEATGVMVVPHNPLSPVSTAACVQLAACISNFTIQEYPKGEDCSPKTDIVVSALRLENGFLIVPEAPGLGVTLKENAENNCPYIPRAYRTRLSEDGSVMDQ